MNDYSLNELGFSFKDGFMYAFHFGLKLFLFITIPVWGIPYVIFNCILVDLWRSVSHWVDMNCRWR